MTICKSLPAFIIGVVFLAGCSNPKPLPKGVTLNVKNGEVYLALDKDVAINVYQNKDAERQFVIVANRGDNLNVVQVKRGGDVPRSLSLFSNGQASFTVETPKGTSPHSLIVDENGDGLPNLKIEGNKRYKAQVVWTEMPRPQ